MTVPRRRVKLLLLGICLTSTIVGIILMTNLETDYSPKDILEYLLPPKLTSTAEFIINTPTCKIPKTPIWPEFIMKDWKEEENPYCSWNDVLAQSNDSDQILRVLPQYSHLNCCLTELFRVDKHDDNFTLSNCAPILENTVDVTEMEMLVINCFNRVNYEANLPTKPTVQRKIDAWKNTKSEELPFNVLVIGIDSVSRSHAYRMMPNTMDLMKRMGFKDFRGYHSVGPFTHRNFMGFLMGLTEKTVRKECAPDWQSSFDSCPFIWKDFSLNDYVTMYVEDGKGSMNWGGQSGFHTPPTDYYIHSLFVHIMQNEYTGCTSTESIPQFVLRYTRRFIQKFEKTPFFAFTWLNNPFHDHPYALKTFDTDSFRFFDSLQSIPGFLERTVIIFLSDHGDRTSYSHLKGVMEAYIERGLPPLFIRFPELLKKRHPELNLETILEQNVNSLTSPYDLHQTFLHMMALDGLRISAPPVGLGYDERQSLLTRIDSRNRSCATLNIPEGYCVCNVNIDDPDKDENFDIVFAKYRSKVIELLRSELNGVVTSSKYKNICAEWIIPLEWVSSIRIFKKTPLHTYLHVQFSADGVEANRTRGIASFEGQVRVTRERKTAGNTTHFFDDCELIGKFSRVNLYGDQSSCVEFVTEADKEMKEFCLCKSYVQTPK